MVIPAKITSAKCIAMFVFCFVYLFIHLFTYLFVCQLVFYFFIVCLAGSQRWLCFEHDDFFYTEQAKDVFSEIHNILNCPGWSRRGHADWYTVLTDPANDN